MKALFYLSCFAFGLHAQECVELSRSSGRVVVRVVSLCPGSDDQSALLNKAQKILRSEPGSQRVKEVIVSTDRRTLQHSVLSRVVGSALDGSGFDQLRHSWLKSDTLDPKNLQSVLRLLQVDSSAVATYSAPGVNRRAGLPPVIDTLLHGSRDPRLVTGSKLRLKLLWVEETGQGTILPAHDLKVFYKAYDSLTCQACRQALQVFQNDRNPKNGRVSVRLRNDTWFDGESFPLLYRFEPEDRDHPLGSLRLPTVDQYYRGAPEIACGLSERAQYTGCILYGAWNAHDALEAAKDGGQKR